MPVKPRPAIDRTLARCVETRDGCWEFTGALSQGYGVVGAGPRGTGTVLTHRLTYTFFVAEVPAGLDLDHLCRNRACCNPWHLEPVTRFVNANRGLRARGYGFRDRTHCKNGHEYTPESTQISLSPDGTFKQRRCITCRRARDRRKPS